MIWLWIMLGTIGLVLWINIFIYGIKICLKNNALGVFLLSIALPFFGIILGCCLIWNNRYFDRGKYLKEEKERKIKEKQQRKIKEKEEMDIYDKLVHGKNITEK